MVIRKEKAFKRIFFKFAGIQDDSRICDGLKVINGKQSLEVNETYVWIKSSGISNIKIGDVLQFNLTLRSMEESIPEFKIFKLNLKVVGFVDLKDDALSIIRGGYSVRPLRTNKDENILIVNWSATCSKIIDTFYEENVKSGGKHYGRPVYTKIIVFLDRDSIINPWDIQSSIEKINRIESQIINKVSLLYKEAHIINRVKSTLIRYQWTSQTLKFQFIIVSLPVFFISWYMGTTVSDVSYNLRRREIGLLLTKGFSRGQIFRMFLGEALLIGILGSVFGIFLSIILVFFMIRETFLNFGLVIGFDTVLMTIIFSVALSLLMIFQPARRASKLDIVDALQEYRYVEDIKPYKKKWPWIAFILGTYKIVIWLLGVNLIVLFMENPPVHNIFLMIILGIWMFFDSTILNSIGPFLFFWGVTKIFIRGSFAFQKAVEKITKPISDLSVLSTKNINRNPARTAAVAFLIAMIIGYAFQVIGTYASTQDYILRQIKFYVGSDISLETRTIENISSIIDKIENLSEALSVTIEYIFHGITADEERSLRLVAVNPSEWPRVAYTEDNLFKGEDMVSAFQKLKNDNFTIILDIGIAEDLKLGLGDNISLKILTATGYRVFSLKIVGFFGTKIQSSPYFPGINRYYLWSYVPEAFYKCIQRETESYGKVLVKICGDSDGKEVVKKIRDLQLPGVIAIYSVDEILEEWREGTLGSSTSTPILLSFVGSEEIQRIGVVIAVLAASIGTFIVTLINLKERSKEIGIMSVRGLSFRQILHVLLTDNLAVVCLSLILGSVVGLTIVHGNISAANSLPTVLQGRLPFITYSPILRRIVFPVESILYLTACYSLILLSTFIPIVLTVKSYVSRIETVVREL